MRRSPIGPAALLSILLAAPIVAHAQYPTGRAPVRGPQTLVEDPSFRALDGGGSRVTLSIRGDATVTAVPGERRLVFHIEGARAAPGSDGGRLITSYEWTPVYSVQVVAAGGGVDLVIELRHPSAATHAIVKGPRGSLLEIDFPEERPAPSAPSAPPAAAPQAGEAPARAALPPDELPWRWSSPPAPAHGARGGAERPTLAGQTLLLPRSFEPAFVTTRFGVRVEAAYSAFDLASSTDHGGGRIGLASFTEAFDVGVRLHDRFGVEASIGGTVASGLDAESNEALGADAGLIWRLALVHMMLRREREGLQVGARIGVEGGSGKEVLPIRQLAVDVVHGDAQPSVSNALASRHDLAARFQLHAVEMFLDHLSAQLAVGWVTRSRSFRYARAGAIVERYARGVDLTVGLALAANAGPEVPLGAQLEYSVDAPLALSPDGVFSGTASLASPEDAQFVGAGLYYTGRRELLLGAVLGAEAHRSEPARATRTATLLMRYFF